MLIHGRSEERLRRGFARIKSWAGYAWFMTLGTVLPLVVFLVSYLLHVTLLGAPLARVGYRFGIWSSTFGQEPPGKGKVDSRKQGSDKKSVLQRVKPYSPPGIIERRGRPVSPLARAVWFVFVGWWLGVIWVLLSWSVFLAPYPFLDTVRALLDELPSVMTLAFPASRNHEDGPTVTA